MAARASGTDARREPARPISASQGRVPHPAGRIAPSAAASTRPKTACKLTIQNRIATRSSSRVSRLVSIIDGGKEQSAPGGGQHARLNPAEVGVGDQQDARKADGRRQQPGAGLPFAQKQRREQDHPQGRGELQREDLRQRDRGQRPEPQGLASEMHGVAQDMAAQAAGAVMRAGRPVVATTASTSATPMSER